MKTPLKLIVILLLIFNVQKSSAQLVKVDTTYISGGGPNSIARQIDFQSTGKVILTGEFNVYSGGLANRIVRLNTNGNLDTSYKSGFGTDGPIRAATMQPDDKIIIGGLFNSYNNTARKNIARINANGTLDTSFAKGAGANNEITKIHLQHDGKILLAGIFGKYDNTFLTGFVRLTNNGEVDTTFKMGMGPSLGPNDISQQRDHKIIIVGSFLFYDGIPRNKIVRINLNGTLDTTFKNNSISNNIQKVLVLNNDEILITGGFTNIDGVTKTGIAKLSKDGVLDTSFNAFILGTVRSLHQQKDGKIIVCGDFTNVNGVSVQRLARLNPDGTLDNTFYAGFNGSVYDIAEQADKKILLAGNFTQVTEVPTKVRAKQRFVRLENDYCSAPTTPIFFDTHAHACKGDIVQIQIDLGELNDAKNWYWYLDTCGGIPVDSGRAIQVQVKRNAKYYVRAEQYCGNQIGACSVFQVFMNDTIDNTVRAVNQYLIADQSNVFYQWYNCDSIPYALTGETRQSLEPIVDGKYFVQLISVDSCIAVSDCISFQVPILIGINKQRKLNIENPVSDKIILPLDKQLKNISVYNNLGQTLIQLKITDTTREVNIEELAVGVYLLKANDVNGNTYTERIVVRR